MDGTVFFLLRGERGGMRKEGGGGDVIVIMFRPNVR